jgi:uncharacterized protein YjlB
VPILEDMKEYAERTTGLGRPGKRKAPDLAQTRKGDVVILPAGTGHQCLSASNDFLVIGAYPPCTTVEDRPRALKSIPKVPSPRKDPVYGTGGPLPKLWKKAK